jgi:ketosteroid isomerase-like protein
VSDSARVETVRRMFDAFSLDHVDEEVLAACLAPDVELHDFPSAEVDVEEFREVIGLHGDRIAEIRMFRDRYEALGAAE